MSESTGARKAFLLRIAPDLWADLEVWARDELRSVNGQIEYLLRQAILKRRYATQSQGDAGKARPSDDAPSEAS